MLNRRYFIKFLLSSIVAAGCGSDIGRGSFTEDNSHDNKKTFKIYAVTDTSNWVIKDGVRINLYDYKFIDGVTNYIKWSYIESEEGIYNWKGLDRLLTEAALSGKKLSYNILGGDHAPDWAFDKYLIPAYHCWCCETETERRTYFPWIETQNGRYLNTKILEIWERTVENFAGFLKSHQFRNCISYITITGGPTSNGLEIMWSKLYNAPELNWGSHEEELFIEFWKRLIDIYIRNFSDFPLGIAFADVFPNSSESCQISRNISISNEIVKYALAEAEQKNAIIRPLGLWFGNIPPELLSSHSLVEQFWNLGAPFAVQGHIRTEDSSRLENMLYAAIDFGANWIELWHSDVIDPNFQEVLIKFREEINFELN
ncbi:MAG: hypothetical protein QY316_06500 [Thermodesulfobacteriota bacterium]|nr:MAG: hypothetical protein QY316_06500 [Thermodesulfobacteriota bacterium]